MIRAVMGVGPRAGTSFTMKELLDAGLPVHWDPSIDAALPVDGNPRGYYETLPSDYRSVTDKIVKVWPLAAQYADIERMVVLERNRESQLASIAEQVERERELLDALDISWTPEEFLDRSSKALSLYLSIPHLRVRTEDLSERIDEIISYLRY